MTVVAFVIALAFPAGAATTVFHGYFRGVEAEAEFSWTNGCIESDALVFAEQGRLRQDTGAPTRDALVEVEVVKFDNCHGLVLADAFGSAVLPEGAFQADKNLGSATLLANVPMTDLTLVSYSIGVNVSWTGTGAWNTSKSHIQQKLAGFTYMENFPRNDAGRARHGHVQSGQHDPRVGAINLCRALQRQRFGARDCEVVARDRCPDREQYANRRRSRGAGADHVLA